MDLPVPSLRVVLNRLKVFLVIFSVEIDKLEEVRVSREEDHNQLPDNIHPAAVVPDCSSLVIVGRTGANQGSGITFLTRIITELLRNR